MDIRLCTPREIFSAPNVSALWEEYARESAAPELGEHDPQVDMYEAMWAAGALYALGAFDDEQLVGVIVLLVSSVPHFGKRIATTESFFVRRAARSRGLGLRLLRAAEVLAADQGAQAFYVSSPAGGALEQVLPRAGYRHANALFVRRLAC